MLHDVGKLGTENQDDFKNIKKFGDKVHKHGLDHSTAGGRLALELIKAWPVLGVYQYIDLFSSWNERLY